MASDEEQIRELVSKWMTATEQQDADTVLSLIADDAVFLTVGQPVMTKADFADAAATGSPDDAPHIDATSNIREIRVAGDWAFMWAELTVVVTPPAQQPITRKGHTLTIFKKMDGRWLLARDSNTMAPNPPR